MGFVIGLTGGIASGKTTVANLFHDNFAIDVVDADLVAREVVEVGSAGLDALTQHFGVAILQADGSLNRSALRERIFANEDEKLWVNNLLHPMIRERMQSQLDASTSPYTLFVVPLLIENGLQTMADRVLVVDVCEETQIYRTMTRDGVPESQVRSILKSQVDRETRLLHADDVIDNNTDNAQLLSQVTELHQKYLALCEQNR
ncbi:MULTISPECIES: dephospho-CoA kinase [Vibrio]|uniref:Dephospho-CoA kinase n=1 Tax=Vibrio mediterranei TaxID=689 RepID=A0A3G4V9T0_9VIBR|nr:MULTISPECIES: dephospho-CoA kinase [Vibrio]AYV21059.1 dephospho-CoA kinase [Vibrio mediterranei]EDL51851.1 dephospho-CoA kinase [Vibrio mediterranei AK1]MCY9852898.1 dephospho-CoA kinase [Vibrio mediterranei]